MPNSIIINLVAACEYDFLRTCFIKKIKKNVYWLFNEHFKLIQNKFYF